MTAASSPPDEVAYGRLLYAVRPTPRWNALLVLAAILLAAGGLVWLTDRSVWSAVAGFTGAGLALSAICLGGFVDKHRVHEHAVLLGPTWPGTQPYVVPLSTIDPSTITFHLRARQLPRRLHNNGLPTMRCAIYTTWAVSFIGLSYEAARGDRNPAVSAAHQRAGLFYGRGEMPTEAASRWVLGIRRPRPLLDALEAALAADGRPQPGLAAFVETHPVTEPSGQPARSG